MNKAPNELSFLPDDYIARKIRRRAQMILATLFLAVLTGTGAAAFVTIQSTREIEQRHAAVAQQFATEARQIEQVQQLQAKQEQMARRAELTASLLEKLPRSYVLARLINSMPAGLSLNQLDLDTKEKKQVVQPTAVRTAVQKREAAAAKPVEAPKELEISLKLQGIAQSDIQVSQFMGRLRESPFLNEINLVVTEEFELKKDKEKVRRFTIEMKIDPRAQITPEESRKSAPSAAVEISK